MKHLKISIPDGYEIDKAQSTFENIVFKPTVVALPKTWEELDEIDGCFVHSGSTEVVGVIGGKSIHCNRNIFATKEQAYASIALAQLSQLMQVYNNGWVPDWTYSSDKYTIEQYQDEFRIETRCLYSAFIAFEKEETAKLFLENFKDLIIIAKPLL
jgi:hypothetical protein